METFERTILTSRNIWEKISKNYNFKKVNLDKLVYFLLLFVSGILVFYRFGSLPLNLAYDELEFAKIVFFLDVNPWRMYIDYATGHTTLYFHLVRVFFVIFGASNVTLRLPSALSTVMAPILWVLILRRLGVNRTTAFLSGFFLAFDRVFFQFGRFAFEGNFLLALELGAIVSFLCYVLGGKRGYFYLSIALTIAAFHSYTPGRLFILTMLGLIYLLKNKIIQWKKIAVEYLLWWGAGILPLIFSIRSLGDERVSSLAIHTQPYLDITQKVFWYWVNLGKFVMQWHLVGDGNARHNFAYRPYFNDISGVLFLIGIGVWLRNMHDKFARFVLIMGIVATLPTLLVNAHENPNFLRIVGLYPLIAYLCAIGLEAVVRASIDFMQKLDVMQPSRISLLLSKKVINYVLISIIFCMSAIWNLKIYFRDQAGQMHEAFRVPIEIADFGKERLIPLDLSLPEYFPR